MRRLALIIAVSTVFACKAAPTPTRATTSATWLAAELGELNGRRFSHWRDGKRSALQLHDTDELHAVMLAWLTDLDHVVVASPNSAMQQRLQARGGRIQYAVRRGMTTVEIVGTKEDVAEASTRISQLGLPDIVLSAGGLDPRKIFESASTGKAASKQVTVPGSLWRAPSLNYDEARQLEVLAQLVGEVLRSAKEPRLLQENEGVSVDSLLGRSQSELRFRLYSTESSTRTASLAEQAFKKIAGGDISLAAFELARNRVSGELRRRMTRDSDLFVLLVEAIRSESPIASVAGADDRVLTIDVASLREFAGRWSAR